jgi:hypothetical protein
MKRGSWFRAVSVGVVALAVSAAARAQVPCANGGGVTLKSFNPVDSLFPNPTASTFTIKLVNGVTGCPSEYRVSRFSDFRDANWIPYSATPSTVIQRSWFPATANGTTQITLYFQVRVKNPRGGIPTSLGGPPAPAFFFSDPLGRSIRLIYFG